MNKKCIVAGLIGFATILGWNVFLTQRDEAMYKAYYRQQAMENLKSSPSSEIGYSPKEKFCQSRVNQYNDCTIK